MDSRSEAMTRNEWLVQIGENQKRKEKEKLEKEEEKIKIGLAHNF